LYRQSVRKYRFVFTPKWLGFHALTWLLLIPAFIGLGQWQRDLWRDRADSQGLVYKKLAAAPVTLDSADPAGHTVPQSEQWQMVKATGRYDVAGTLMVRNRSQNENPGWYVVVPLVLPDGSAVLVNQGWIAESQTADPTIAPPPPPMPTGEVTVTGSIQPDETTSTTRIHDNSAVMPPHEIALISKPDIAGRVPYSLRDGSIELTASSPAETAAAAAQPVPGPSYDNTMYIAYMIQWWVFAVVMPVTWIMLIRREASDLENAAIEAAREAVGADDEGEEEGGDDLDAAGDNSSVAPQPVEQGGEPLGGEQLESLSDAVRG
jgi:cytochrome oxidase assembly protein ShyY1